jgi:hypothetical protein
LLLEMLSSQSDQSPQTTVTFTLTGAEEDQGKTLAIVEYSAQRVTNEDSAKDGTGRAGIDAGAGSYTSFKLKGTARVDVETGMVFRDESETKNEMKLGDYKRTETVKRTLQQEPAGS